MRDCNFHVKFIVQAFHMFFKILAMMVAFIFFLFVSCARISRLTECGWSCKTAWLRCIVIFAPLLVYPFHAQPAILPYSWSIVIHFRSTLFFNFLLNAFSFNISKSAHISGYSCGFSGCGGFRKSWHPFFEYFLAVNIFRNGTVAYFEIVYHTFKLSNCQMYVIGGATYDKSMKCSSINATRLDLNVVILWCVKNMSSTLFAVQHIWASGADGVFLSVLSLILKCSTFLKFTFHCCSQRFIFKWRTVKISTQQIKTKRNWSIYAATLKRLHVGIVLIHPNLFFLISFQKKSNNQNLHFESNRNVMLNEFTI